MLGLSLPEIIFLAVLALVVIGPKQLPEVAKTIGRFLNELRRTTNTFTEEFKSQVKIDPIRLDEKPLPPHYYNQPSPAEEASQEAESGAEKESTTVTTDNPKRSGQEDV
ncbi:MAG: twin-arginine translocase TatA/TatE family subunit [Bdellovibrionaceae bacterium]|nr:twin-arginine translocase TatA/TatE family subunit [Pseudobdellovibrionaceae bacterium]